MSATPAELYEQDFYAWTQLQARELRRFARTRPNLPLDLAHLAEEIGDLGKEQRNSLRSWVQKILEHLLLLEHSPAAEPRPGWASEILDFRSNVEKRLSRTLRRDLKVQLPKLYADARKIVARKMELHGERPRTGDLPPTCPYTLEQVLGDWWPEGI